MYHFVMFCIFMFLWLCGSVFSFVSYIATHKIRKIPAFKCYDVGLPEVLIWSLICSPVVGIITWLMCLYDVIQSKLHITDKVNEWTCK